MSVEQLNPNISIFVTEGKEKGEIVTFLKLGAEKLSVLNQKNALHNELKLQSLCISVFG